VVVVAALVVVEVASVMVVVVTSAGVVVTSGFTSPPIHPLKNTSKTSKPANQPLIEDYWNRLKKGQYGTDGVEA
jgi:hypothetical protein